MFNIRKSFIYFVIECTPGQHFVKCNPNDDAFCIAEVFRNDGIFNCPPIESKYGDESSPKAKPKGQQNLPKSPDPNGAGTQSSLNAFTIIAVYAILYALFY